MKYANGLHQIPVKDWRTWCNEWNPRTLCVILCHHKTRPLDRQEIEFWTKRRGWIRCALMEAFNTVRTGGRPPKLFTNHLPPTSKWFQEHTQTEYIYLVTRLWHIGMI